MFRRVEFLGNSLECLRAFPDSARRVAGFQLDRVQQGLEPNDWKPMASIGPGVQEVRIRVSEGAFRVIYLARFQGIAFVIHCFQKKTQKTSGPDIDLVKVRYKELRRRFHE